MKVTNLKRLVVEDFESDDQEMITKVAFSYNPLIEQITQAFNGNIDFDNLNQEVLTFEVELDATGKPKADIELRSSLRGKPRGTVVIRAENLTLDGTFPTAVPFITFSIADKNIELGVPPTTGVVPMTTVVAPPPPERSRPSRIRGLNWKLITLSFQPKEGSPEFHQYKQQSKP